MGKKFKYLIFLSLVISSGTFAQEKPDFRSTDSLTWSYYLSGKWDSLIIVGEKAIASGTDYKFLRQRIGFAYFTKGDFYRSADNFSAALEFDSYDNFTLKYLYLTYYYLGAEDMAAIIAGKMNDELRQSLAVRTFKLVESLDFEYNFKYAGTNIRSHPKYFHIGASSRLGSRLYIYQMYSDFRQTLTIRYPVSDVNINIVQPEYYLYGRLLVSKWLSLKGAWHYVGNNNTVDMGPVNIAYGGISIGGILYNFGCEFSSSETVDGSIVQAGINGAVTLSKRSGFYLKTSLSWLDQSSGRNLIYDQRAGYRLGKKSWMEWTITTGNMLNYIDMSAMYFYNSIDPTVFRAGPSLFLYPSDKISLWFSFGYEKKEFFENNLFSYNQFSYLGGIRWKL